MFLVALCLVGTALAAPAIPEAPFLRAESQVLVSPYITYPDPMFPLRSLDITFEPEVKENAEIPEPKEELEKSKEEFTNPEESKEALPELPVAPELPKPETPKPLVVKLVLPKPPSFITDWISSLPITLPQFSLPSFIDNWFPPTANPTKVFYSPAYYTGYPGSVIVEAPKP